jgi:hypothetical protein
MDNKKTDEQKTDEQTDKDTDKQSNGHARSWKNLCKILEYKFFSK